MQIFQLEQVFAFLSVPITQLLESSQTIQQEYASLSVTSVYFIILQTQQVNV